MTLTKNKMVREIGRRTRLKNRDVQHMLETLINLWTEELISGGRIELENFLVLETSSIRGSDQNDHTALHRWRIALRASRRLKHLLNSSSNRSR